MSAQALELLGSPARRDGESRSPMLPERAHQLAAALATSGEWQSRERLAALFWPDLNSAAARRNVRHLLFKAGPHWPSLELRSGAVRLCIPVDAREFEAAHDEGDFARAIALYRGSFAEGLEANAPEPFAEWVRFERNRFTAMFRAAAGQRIGQLADPADRERLARHWLHVEPLDEDALVALVEAVAAGGRDAESRRLADGFARQLAQQLGIEPSARVRALTSAGPPAALAPTPLRGRGPDVVGAAEHGFVGRRIELQELCSLLERDECRVLTVTGPGGIGKSRLARVALAQLSSRHEAAAWVALDDLSDLAQVAPRIAAELDLTLGGQGDPLQQVIDRLRPRRVLLVADNSEHLDGFAALCARLSAACPLLKILHTSRARLAIAGEWLLPLAGLPVPDADENDAEVLRNFDAVRLFEARARAVSPSFDGHADAGQVASLARELEGAPLAIELAAAWVRILPVADIRTEIAGSLDLLEGPASGGRQRSVVASFEHSWNMLAPVEQQALARLSVFAAPFTREAAAQVADAGLPVLAALVDKSLLRAEGDGRVSFHALTRQCARDKLDAADATRRRHTAYFAQALARRDGASILRKNVLDEVERDLEDSRLAWRHAVQSRSAIALEQMAVPLMRFLQVKGRLAEGIDLMQSALRAFDVPADDATGAAAPPPPPLMMMAALHRSLGTLHYRKGHLELADDALSRAAALYRESGVPGALRPCLMLLGVAAWARGDAAVAERHFDDVLRLGRDEADDDAVAMACNGLALCARARGEYDRALGLHEQSLRLHQRAGNAASEAAALHDIGFVQFNLRRFEDAERTLRRALAACDASGLAHLRVYCLVSLGMTQIEQDALDAARATLERAQQADASTGPSLVSSAVRLSLARSAIRSGELAVAAPLLAEGLALARAAASAPKLLAAIVFAAEWLAAAGQRARAAALWHLVADDARTEHNYREDARRFLAAPQLSSADADAARRLATTLDAEGSVDALRAELAGESASEPAR